LKSSDPERSSAQDTATPQDGKLTQRTLMVDHTPLRLCCGERHYGPMCPDGLIMCCICFYRVSLGELSEDETGAPIDVCKPCAAR
jgi:hypothetical protein